MSEPSTVLAIADAVAAEMNGAAPGTFSQAFTAIRKTRPRFTLEQLKAVQVVAVPKATASQRTARNVATGDYSVDIAVMQHVPPAADGEVDESKTDLIVALAEEIERFFELRHMDKYPDALWVGTAWNPSGAPYVVQMLDDKSVMAAILTVTFRLMRQKQE